MSTDCVDMSEPDIIDCSMCGNLIANKDIDTSNGIQGLSILVSGTCCNCRDLPTPSVLGVNPPWRDTNKTHPLIKGTLENVPDYPYICVMHTYSGYSPCLDCWGAGDFVKDMKVMRDKDW